MRNRICTRVGVALAVACAAGLTTAVPAHASTEEAYIRLSGPSEDSSTWTWEVESSGGGSRAAALPPPGWICTPVIAPPTFGVTCTVPTVKLCNVGVTVSTYGVPGSTQTGTVACGVVTTAAVATAPGSAGSTTTGAGTMPPFTCVAGPKTGLPAPWVVTCHAVMVTVP